MRFNKFVAYNQLIVKLAFDSYVFLEIWDLFAQNADKKKGKGRKERNDGLLFFVFSIPRAGYVLELRE